ncbi:tripartite tricarboxylate transporter TctB family protein [Sneathiella sp.]|uniref:tripartite tricarboxylate transporter TctB family protein n=1 Tax=Sneathiella sp. TaxID=1964365 RepID=UPI00356551A2
MMIPLTLVLYAGLAALTILLLVTAGSFPEALSGRDIGPAAFPASLAVLMLVLMACDVVISRRQLKRVHVKVILQAGSTALLVALAVWCAAHWGFFYVLPFALFVGLRLAGSKSWLANGIFSVVLPLALWVLFDYVLLIPIATL